MNHAEGPTLWEGPKDLAIIEKRHNGSRVTAVPFKVLQTLLLVVFSGPFSAEAENGGDEGIRTLDHLIDSQGS